MSNTTAPATTAATLELSKHRGACSCGMYHSIMPGESLLRCTCGAEFSIYGIADSLPYAGKTTVAAN